MKVSLEAAKTAAENEGFEAKKEVQENADFIVKCLEERKQQQQIAAMVDTLRKELRAQQESIAKNDARVKKRESEVNYS